MRLFITNIEEVNTSLLTWLLYVGRRWEQDKVTPAAALEDEERAVAEVVLEVVVVEVRGTVLAMIDLKMTPEPLHNTMTTNLMT